MIAGEAATAGRVFERLLFNDKHPETNPVTGAPLRPIPFYSETAAAPSGLPLPTLDLRRVILLTGPNTCSASESLINGLRGIDIEVILIGEPTCGKPYGFYATDNCGTTYFTIQFRGVNAKGFGEYRDGFVPTEGANGDGFTVPGCRAADDFSRPLGNPAEGRLATALGYRDSSVCPVYVSAGQPFGGGAAAANIQEARGRYGVQAAMAEQPDVAGMTVSRRISVTPEGALCAASVMMSGDHHMDKIPGNVLNETAQVINAQQHDQG